MKQLAKNKLLAFAVLLVAIQLILAIGAPLFAPYDPMAQSVARRLRAPSELNWFGTDQLGRDVLTRILYGYRTSLIACLLAVGIALLAGGALGLVAAYYRGWLDRIIEPHKTRDELIEALAIAEQGWDYSREFKTGVLQT